jgi:hypothetical protein
MTKLDRFRLQRALILLTVTILSTLFLWLLVPTLYEDVSALDVTVTPPVINSPTPTATPILTTTPAPALAQTPPSPPPLDSDAYESLTSHFEKVSTQVLTIAKWIVILVGGLGGTSGIIGSYFIISSRQKMLDLKKDTETLESRVEDLQKKVKDAENRIRYVFELRDRNYEVRIRAVQQLGASNDIAAVSMLIESLERDRSINVRMEAAYWLGRLLSDGGESEALREGLRALTTAAKHRNPGVRQVAIEALDTLVCNNVQLTRRTVQQLRAIARLDGSATVIEAAQTALEHIKQQREGTLGSQQGEQQS